jgi:hypothetical protein
MDIEIEEVNNCIVIEKKQSDFNNTDFDKCIYMTCIENEENDTLVPISNDYLELIARINLLKDRLVSISTNSNDNFKYMQLFIDTTNQNHVQCEIKIDNIKHQYELFDSKIKQFKDRIDQCDLNIDNIKKTINIIIYTFIVLFSIILYIKIY